MDYDRVKAYLADNPPPGMVANGSSSSVGGKHTTFSQIYQALTADDPTAYTVPVLFVRVQSLKGRTYLEAATFIDAYRSVPQDVRIGEQVTAVRIEGVSTSTAYLGPSASPAPPVTLTQPQDADLISQLVQAFNALPGSLQANGIHPCPPPLPAPAVVTFTGEDGRVWIATLGTDCNEEIQVSVDGKLADLTLSPVGWLSTLQGVVKQASGSS